MGHHRTHRTGHTMIRERASTMHRRRVRSAVGVRLSAVGVRLSAVVVCAALVAGLSACGGGGGGAGPTAPAAEAPTPLDGVLCDVLPTDLLSDVLGFDSYTYAYFHHPVSGGGYDHPGYYYVCMLQSDYTTWAMLDINYDPDDTIPQIEFEHKVGSVEFDRVPEIFPDAEPVDIDGQDGRGWAWTINNAAYVFWLYPDGHSLYVNLRRANGAKPDADQQRALRTVAAVIIADVPPVAASSPSVSTMHPSPTP